MVNSLTDVGVAFNVGNSFFGFLSSTSAGLVNLGVAAGLVVLRAARECEKVGIRFPLPGAVKRFAEKNGSTLAATGVFNLIAGCAAAAAGDPANIKSYSTAVMLGLFGVGNLTRGVAMRLDPSTAAYRVLEGFGIVTNTAGIMMAAGSEAPVAVHLAFMAAGASGLYQSIGRKSVPIALQPNMNYAAGTTLAEYASVLAAKGTGAFANGFYTIGYLSLEAERTHGGVYELVTAGRRSHSPRMSSV